MTRRQQADSKARPAGIGAELTAHSVSPSTLAAAFVFFVAIWATYFAISEAPAAIHHDMAEAYVWGQEFQLGYYKHPPFWAWICGAWFAVFPRAGWAFAILSSLNAAIGLLGSWKLIGRFAQGDKQVAATLLLLLTPFYTFLSYRYNANTMFLSIWPWTMFAFLRSIDEGEVVDSVLFGLCMAVAMLSKYYAVILGATCLIAALQHPARARYFASASPYVSVAVAAALCAPHLWWLLAGGAPTVRYFSDETGRGLGFVASFAAMAFFGAIAQNAVVFIVVAVVARLKPRNAIVNIRARATDSRFRLLATLATAPLILTVLAAVALRNKISTNMLIGTFSLMPLLAIEIAGARGVERLRTIAGRIAVALSLGALVASPAVALGKAWLSNAPEIVDPRKELAQAATQLWREKTSEPLVYVGGTDRYDDGVVFYSRDRPHGFIHLDFSRSPWVTPQALAASGLLSLCVKDDAGCLTATTGFVTPQSSRTEIILARNLWGRAAKPVTFVATIIPPHRN